MCVTQRSALTYNRKRVDMIIFKILMKFLKILNSEAEPWQIGAGFAIGLFLGITPLVSLHNILLIMLLLVVRVNITSALVSLGIFKAVSLATDPISDQIGRYLLGLDPLAGVWRFLSETPGLALFNLNNTLVLGSLMIALVCALPVFLIMMMLVSLYRNKLKEKVSKWKIVKALKMTKLAKAAKAAGRMK